MSKVLHMPHQPRKPKKKMGWIYLFILGLTVCIITSISAISNKTVKTINPELEAITTELLAEAVFIRDERTIKSPNKGQISYEDLQEGERVRVSHQIATITAQTLEGKQNYIPVTTNSAGVLSFYPDGFEEVLSGKPMGELNLLEVKKINSGQYSDQEKDRQIVEEGTPIFKIINPFSDVNFILYFPQSEILDIGRDPLELKDAPLTLSNGDSEYRINISDIGFAGKDVFCFGVILNNKEDFYSIRKADFRLIIDTKEGYLIDKEAIVIIDEEPGIYIHKGDSYNWVPVEVLKTLPDKSLIMFDDYLYPIVINPQVL
ncbi:MAG: hypothetical protein APF76_05395 [Desulfitibacter sp. BRH_c19]|nr:MAG: hypothetical protein APF76_05395 [Desulfitibacter sp. BRH_c19]